MIVFYANDVSNYCSKVRIVLEAKGLDYRTESPPDGYGSPAYKRIVPAGTIPAIVHDGVVLSESEAINEYLEEVFPTPTLLHGGPAERARQRSFSRFHDFRLEPPLRALFADVDPRRRDGERVALRTAEIGARLAELDRLASFRPFLVTAEFSLADVPYPATLLLAEAMFATFGVAFPTTARIEAWRTRLAEIPAVAHTLALADTATQRWIASRRA